MRFGRLSSHRQMLRQAAAVSLWASSEGLAQPPQSSSQTDAAQSKNPLNLPAMSPDEDVEYTFNQRFSLQTALSAVERVDKSLRSFRELTDRMKKKQGIPPHGSLPGVEQTAWVMQSLGFPNMVTVLKGTLLKQNYLVKEAEFELARERHEHGKVDQTLLEQRRSEYEKAVNDFKEFWNSAGIAD